MHIFLNGIWQNSKLHQEKFQNSEKCITDIMLHNTHILCVASAIAGNKYFHINWQNCVQWSGKLCVKYIFWSHKLFYVQYNMQLFPGHVLEYIVWRQQHFVTHSSQSVQWKRQWMRHIEPPAPKTSIIDIMGCRFTSM